MGAYFGSRHIAHQLRPTLTPQLLSPPLAPSPLKLQSFEEPRCSVEGAPSPPSRHLQTWLAKPPKSPTRQRVHHGPVTGAAVQLDSRALLLSLVSFCGKRGRWGQVSLFQAMCRSKTTVATHSLMRAGTRTGRRNATECDRIGDRCPSPCSSLPSRPDGEHPAQSLLSPPPLLPLSLPPTPFQKPRALIPPLKCAALKYAARSLVPCPVEPPAPWILNTRPSCEHLTACGENRKLELLSGVRPGHTATGRGDALRAPLTQAPSLEARKSLTAGITRSRVSVQIMFSLWFTRRDPRQDGTPRSASEKNC